MALASWTVEVLGAVDGVGARGPVDGGGLEQRGGARERREMGERGAVDGGGFWERAERGGRWRGGRECGGGVIGRERARLKWIWGNLDSTHARGQGVTSYPTYH